MPNQPLRARPHRDLQALILILMLLGVAFHLGMAATGRAIIRDQHLGGAVEYARGSIDLLRPVIPGFNANGTATPLEFPIWQAMTAVLMKCFGEWYGWGNVVSLAFVFSTLWPLFDLGKRLVSERAGWWAVFFTMSQPLILIEGGRASADGAAWAFSLWFAYFCFRMLLGPRWVWWLCAVAVGCLSATTKPPFFLVAGLAAFFWLWRERRGSTIAWVQLISAGAIGAGAFFWWNHHATHIYEQAELPLWDLNVARNPQLKAWYFGSASYRLNPFNWARAGWRMMSYVVGNLGLVFLLLAALRLKRTAAAWLWLASAVCATLLFTPLVLEHFHYFFIFAPAIALLLAIGAAEFEPPLWEKLRAGLTLRTTMLGAFCLFTLAQVAQTIHIGVLFDRYPVRTAETLRQQTLPSDKLVVWGPTWGAPFLRANRQGLTGGLFERYRADWVNDPPKLATLKRLGYTKLVFINPSPYIVALTVATGTHADEMQDLRRFIPDVARAWPVVFDSPEMLIVDIPKDKPPSPQPADG